MIYLTIYGKEFGTFVPVGKKGYTVHLQTEERTMKKNSLKRLLSAGLVLGMLLPWVTTAPVSAAQVTGTANTGTVLYSKTADEIYNGGETRASREKQVTQQWGPNTQDTKNGTSVARLDVDLFEWGKIWGPNETSTSGHLVKLWTTPCYSDDNYFYGLPDDADGTPGTLSLTMKKDAGGNTLSLNTNEYGEIVLTFQYVRSDKNTPSIDQVGNGFQVRVSTDEGTTWKEGYAGMKSHRVIAEGNLQAGGTGSLVKCYEVTSEDLTALAEGETITAIQIRPFGDYDDFNESGRQYTYLRSISITGYETAAPDESTEYVHVDGDILRQIVAAHAKRLNGDTWTSNENVLTHNSWDENGNAVSGTGITYYKDVPYNGPVYSVKNASTYERFLSTIDENGNYTGVYADDSYDDAGLNGMDCITVVYDCLSQITTSRSLSGWNYLFYDLYDEEDNPNGKGVPMYQAAGRGGIDRYSSDEYFDKLVSADGGRDAMYALYDELKPGDFIYNEAHTRVITSPTKDQTVYVGETAGGSIEHHYRLKNGEEVSFVNTAYNEDPESYVRENPDTVSEHLYSTSMRYDRPITYTTNAGKGIYDQKYLPYTMMEYETGKVEKENVLITTNSNNPADFITNGFCAAIDSNYMIRVLTVTLANNSYPGASDLYSKSVYGVQSDYSYLFADEELNAELECLLETPGKYELRVEALSGPRIYLENGDVISNVADASNTVNPTTTFTYDFTTQHTLTVGEVENGSIELDKTSGKYGDTVTVTATPDAGYMLVAIHVDGTPIEGNTFTICGDNEVTAEIIPNVCTVTVDTAEHGTVTVDKDNGVYGETVTVTVVPDEHYKLKHILVDGTAIAGDTFTIARNHMVTAVFEPITYTVSVTGAQNGAVTVDKYSGVYGETVTVTANPADGYVLSTILVNGEAIQGTTFTITGNHTVSARFEQDAATYTVKVVQPDNGTVEVNKNSGQSGESVTVTATPDEGYKLWAVLVDGVSCGSTFTIRGDHTVTALFVPEAFVFGEDETAPVAITGPQAEPEEEPEVGYVGTSMALEGVIRLNVFTTMNGFDADLDLAQAAGMLVWNEYPGATPEQALNNEEVTPATVKGATKNAQGWYQMTTDGIPAAEWGDTVYLLAFVENEDGSRIYADEIKNTSPRRQAEYLIANNPDFADVSIALLNYGAAAQTYFNYKADELMNENLTAAQKELGWTEEWLVELEAEKGTDLSADDAVQITGAWLTLEGAIDLNFQVAVDSSVTVTEGGLLVWTQDQHSKLDTLTAATALKYGLSGKNGSYSGRCAEIPAAEIGRTVYACAYVMDESGETHYSAIRRTSPMSYAKAAIEYYGQTDENLVNCMKWLVKYGHIANETFNGGED